MMLDDDTALIFDMQCCIRFYALTKYLPVATIFFLDVKNEVYTNQKVISKSRFFPLLLDRWTRWGY